MRLFTSFYSSPLVALSGLEPVRTSIGFPRFKLRYTLTAAAPLLYPRRDMLRLEEGPYRAEYLQLLDDRGLDAIRADLELLDAAAAGRGLVLLCFESLKVPGEFCHRRLFAAWWHQHTGERVDELGASPTGRRRATQRRAFE